MVLKTTKYEIKKKCKIHRLHKEWLCWGNLMHSLDSGSIVNNQNMILYKRIFPHALMKSTMVSECCTDAHRICVTMLCSCTWKLFKDIPLGHKVICTQVHEWVLWKWKCQQTWHSSSYIYKPTFGVCACNCKKLLPLQCTSSSKRFVSSESSSAFFKSTYHNLIMEKIINNVAADANSKLPAIRPILTNRHKGLQVYEPLLPLAQVCADSYDGEDVLTLDLVANCPRFFKSTSPSNHRLEIYCNPSSTMLEDL